ncbi:YbhB/YbcL family Raf kinase inhibitor-like protein [Lysinibacter sp. HNR]|uniref:YbhB/YbcL family Raf kinase inhibitor-like protein n=1 Tax=Lysinibacter sp. HNR TaxID=3031408 RepID=UPI002435BA93|nr:YbhB/YbcL family Raf kinase inhibitor-like protein [Lysinibacter sp. HNR]WGD36513.1 YbhB/YbcL family Raf kinase inhibitor-like protein [Lysinibacter sp. HNR]
MFDYDPYKVLAPVPSFTLMSDEIQDGRLMPAAQYSQSVGGSDASPHLSWSGFAPETKSFALTCFDPDAPTASGFWHWAVFNIPAEVTTLESNAGAPSSPLLPSAAVTLPNEMRLSHFIGAAPPQGTGVHRYFFVVHALDVESLDIDPRATPAVLGFNLHFHTLGRAILTGLGEFGAPA